MRQATPRRATPRATFFSFLRKKGICSLCGRLRSGWCDRRPKHQRLRPRFWDRFFKTPWLRTWSGRGPSGLPACPPRLVARNPGFAMVDTRSSTRTVLTPSDTRRETRGWSHARRVGLRAGVIGSVWIFAFVASTRSPMDVVLDWLPWLTAIVIGAGGCYWLGSRSAPAVAKRVPNDAAPSKVHPAAYAVVIEGGPAGLQLGTLVRRRSATRRSFCTARPLACLAASLLRS